MQTYVAPANFKTLFGHRRWAVGMQLLAMVAALVFGASSARAAASANLSIRATTKTLVVGSPGTYVVTVRNHGPSTTDDIVTVTDTLPPGLSFASSSGDWNCTANGAAVTCTPINPLSVGASTFSLVVNVSDAALPRVTNQLTVSYAGDTRPIGNTTTRRTNVRQPRFPAATPTPMQTPPPGTATRTGQPTATATNTKTPVNTPTQTPGVPNATDLQLVKTVSGAFIVGSNGTYLLSVKNIGLLATNAGMTVVDNLPAPLGFVSASGSGWTCSNNGQTVTCTTSSPLAPAATTSIVLTVSISAAAAPTTTNNATLTYPGDTDPSNNNASRPTTVRTS